jgi:hypothetical protein
MGTKTRQFDSMNVFYRDILNLHVLSIDDKCGRFELDDGTEVHVYGSKDEDHEFFGDGPVVAFEVDSFAVARNKLLSAGIEFIYPEPQRRSPGATSSTWRSFSS